MVELITTQTTKSHQMHLLSSYDLAYTKQAQQRNISELSWHNCLGNIVIKYSSCVINFASKSKTLPPYPVLRNRTFLSDNWGTCGLFSIWTLKLVLLMVWSKSLSTWMRVPKKQRGFYMIAWRYEISLRMFKTFHECAANK